ncbi:MAG: hypothetical protein U5L72_17155 [Bacteroidales bacterium]|nr:hypothetical protein [Bacteroidales bacterium]
MRTKLTLLLLAILAGTALAQPEERIADTPALNYDWRPGFISITELTGGPGLGTTAVPYAKYYYGINTMAGYQFTRNIKAGIGVGVHIHNDETMFPVYADARFSLNAQEFVPFLSAVGGVALNFGDPERKVWMYINPSACVKWVVANRTGISLSAGVMSMSGGGSRHSFLNFRLGAEFKFKENR